MSQDDAGAYIGDLGDDPEVAATILAEQLGVDINGIFIITEEIDGGYNSALFRGGLAECLEQMEFIDEKGRLTVMEEEFFNMVRRSVN